ncbi:hypothetical protein T06_7241 [Trichinella sp. T6]|nr:hypothetical protein T06_7241 [Trichinella sp. T6]
MQNSSAYEVFYTIYTMISTAQNLYVYFILDVIDDLVLKVKKVSTRFFVLNEAPDVIVEPLKF